MLSSNSHRHQCQFTHLGKQTNAGPETAAGLGSVHRFKGPKTMM